MPVSISSLPPLSSRGSTRSRALKVLLAEDSPVIQELARAMLHGLGCQVEVVADGISALEALALAEFDLVLMDCQMPDLDGWSATRALRRQERRKPQSERLPVIALTADSEPGDKVRCLDAGMDDLLGKPFSETQLKQVLLRWGKSGRQTQGPGLGSVDAPWGHESGLDAGALQQLQSLPLKIRARLLDVYTRDAPQLVEIIATGVLAGDHGSVLAAAHRLKSSSASLGASRLAALCKSMEAQARQRSFEDPARSAEALQGELTRAVSALTKLRGTLP